MTVIHTVSPRTSGIRRTADVLVDGPRHDREHLVRSRRPSTLRPAGAPMRYYRTGVAMSVAPHRKRPVTMVTTVGLALLAGVITLWLGLVTNLGQMANGDSGGSAARSPTGWPSCGSKPESPCKTSLTG